MEPPSASPAPHPVPSPSPAVFPTAPYPTPDVHFSPVENEPSMPPLYGYVSSEQPQLSPRLSLESPAPSVLLPDGNRQKLGGPSWHSSSRVAFVFGFVAGVAAILFLLAVCYFRFRRKRNRLYHHSTSSGNSESPSKELLPIQGTPRGSSCISFRYEELAAATDGFSEDNLLGEGGFGYVYKGILPGKEIAVKQLKKESRQGDREFQAEVSTISNVNHKHLVSLVGYCISGDERLLVYEFVANKTLRFHLHEVLQPVMDWATRMRVAIGSAKGLAYLHEECYPTIIHRDIKSSNILLDSRFEAKVSDFGLARFFDADNHVSSRVVGTLGYIDPEYVCSGKSSDKSDVFAFGIILLELITGLRATNNIRETASNDSLYLWAKPLLKKVVKDGNYATLVDPRLQGNYNKKQMARMVACAAHCVGPGPNRPRMSQIVCCLEETARLSQTSIGESVKSGLLSDSFMIDLKALVTGRTGFSTNIGDPDSSFLNSEGKWKHPCSFSPQPALPSKIADSAII